MQEQKHRPDSFLYVSPCGRNKIIQFSILRVLPGFYLYLFTLTHIYITFVYISMCVSTCTCRRSFLTRKTAHTCVPTNWSLSNSSGGGCKTKWKTSFKRFVSRWRRMFPMVWCICPAGNVCADLILSHV